MSVSQSEMENEILTPGLVRLTSGALDKIQHFAGTNAEYQGKAFRVFIEGGGCSGFQYGFTFDDRKEDDTLIEAGEVGVLIDPQSAMYLNGSVIDFVQDLRGSGFVVKNPNASGTCGCGLSFSV